MQAGNQLLNIKRLCQIIICAHIQAINALIQSRTRRHENHWGRIPLLAHRPQNAEPVTTWQHDVQHNGIIRARLNEVIRIRTIRAQLHIKPLLA